VVPTPTLTALAFVAACAVTLNAWIRTVRPNPPRTRMPIRVVGYASVNVAE
jgi:hypothetical protein